ncbi:uncharacterized protein [Argopecten irradians]|uniref:uncharacterized protein n=1 Tax=Argopecten irradians TaxID=31199 RepID=UPI003711C267
MPHGHGKGSKGNSKGRPNHQIAKYFLRSEDTTPESTPGEDSTLTENKMADSRQNTCARGNSSREKEKGTNVHNTEVTNKDLKELIVSSTNKLTSRIDCVFEKVATIEGKVKELESGLSFVNQEIESLKTVSVKKTHISELEERISLLENELIYQEFRSRKYNLLIYGVNEPSNEVVEDTLCDFMKSSLKLDADLVKSILLSVANAHRIPKLIHDDTNEADKSRPNALIVKFTRIKIRNLVLAAAKNIDRSSRMSVRTDLPATLKKERSELAKVAYKMRKDDGLQTAIRESPKGVRLEFRKDKNSRWEVFKSR